ncbi:hypothetical protein C8Q75DRAFT_748511 [Abortiporus biennis]|nr:hypothetical protein C8Q75DRAFT_748511 [Abortiporus biennis]
MLGIQSTLSLLLVLVSAVVSVSGALYPTRPVASTVWSAGHSQSVTWLNDKHKPSIRDMGYLDIKLYAEDTYVATLAKSVDPRDRYTEVFISPDWSHNGSDYHIRFTCQKPRLTIYTADFTVTNMASVSQTEHTQQQKLAASPAPNGPSSTKNQYAPLTLGLPNSTYTTPSAQPSNTVSPIADQQQDSGDSSDGIPNQSGSSIAGRRVDMEKIKFRLVFILWPALIGISMAL